MDTFKITEHDPQLGITTTVHRNESSVTIQKSYDAEPFVETAKAIRSETDGERWGEMRHVGFIPMAVLSTFFRQDGGFDRKRAMAWIKANPAMCTFSKALK